MSWTDQKTHTVTTSELDLFRRVKKRFACGFCGHDFVLGDQFRWVYTNDTPGAGGNPFICHNCDHGEARKDLADRYAQLRKEFNAPKFWAFRKRNELS